MLMFEISEITKFHVTEYLLFVSALSYPSLRYSIFSDFRGVNHLVPFYKIEEKYSACKSNI